MITSHYFYKGLYKTRHIKIFYLFGASCFEPRRRKKIANMFEMKAHSTLGCFMKMKEFLAVLAVRCVVHVRCILNKFLWGQNCSCIEGKHFSEKR